MDLPITRPSMISYADELEFIKLLKDLSVKKHNGFIRITSGSEEGYILFKQGKEIAASYDRHNRVDAIEKIKEAMDDSGTIIEIFDVRQNQIDFFMDMNKPYIIGSDARDLIDELKRTKELNNKEPESVPEPKAVPKPKLVSEAIKESENISKPTKTETVEQKPVSQTVSPPVNQQKPSTGLENVPESETVKSETVSEMETKPVKESITAHENEPEMIITPVSETKPVDDTVSEVVQGTEKVPEINEPEMIITPVSETKPVDDKVSEVVQGTEKVPEVVPKPVKTELEVNESYVASPSPDKPVSENLNSTSESTESKDQEPISKSEIENSEMKPMDRTDLMKKYGIKEIQEQDVENILESYKGGSVSDEDIEKIELTLMNKIKKSILAIPKIRGAEVMVFLDNTEGLSGKINIIIESEAKGFLSRIMGDSNNINLERQIINISQIEIRKSFRKYPEIVDLFDVNVEIS